MSTDARASTTHELLVEIGRGGVGIVHLARREDARLVVRKSLRPELARNVAVRRMFLEEARVAQQVRHANVVEVLATGFDAKGVPWIEMEWAPGASLQAIEDAAPLPRDLYVRVVADLLAGLHAAHVARGTDGALLELVHRDVSPHNVLVTFEGDVKVLDFGIAKVKDSHVETTTGVVKGKATYLAPEQASRGEVDARTDLFAVGVMLWQSIAGRRIWEGMSEPEIFHRLVTGEIPDLREVAPDAPEALACVVRRALAPKKDDRYATAEAMRDELLAAIAPRDDARAAIAHHVKDAFADELRETNAIVAGTATVTASARTAGASEPTGTLSAAAKAPSTRRRAPLAWAAVAVAIAGAATFALTTRRTPAPSSPAAAPLAPAACIADESCAAGDHCGEDGACVTLARDGCRVLPDDLPRASRPLYFGALFPLSGPDADAYGRSNARAAELAVREINRLAGGVPFGDARRPLGLLACDDAADADARARYLADRVPAVIGFRTSDEALALSRDVFFPKGVLAVSALNASPLLAQLPAGKPRLFFRATASAIAFAAPIARAVSTMLAPEARKRTELGATDRVRVSVVRSGNATGIAYADQILRELGQPADLDVQETALGEGAADAGSALSGAIDALAKRAPHVVVAIGDGVFEAVVKPLEARVAAPEAKRPIYLVTTPWEDDGFRAFVRARPERRRRFFAVSWPTSHRALTGFVERYRESFGEVLTPTTASPGPYDSVYLLAYAAASLAGTRATGASLSRGIERLLPGAPRVEIGPSAVVSGLATVARGERIDLDGIISRFDFDLATGDSPVDAVLLCTTYDPATKAVDARDVAIKPGRVACP